MAISRRVEEISPAHNDSALHVGLNVRHTFEATVHGDAASNLTIDLTRMGRDGRRGVSNRETTHESISTSKGGERHDESGEIMLDVEALHHTMVDLLDGAGAVAWDVTVVSEGVQSRAGSSEIIKPWSDVGMILICR
jgi:hypothetical protein